MAALSEAAVSRIVAICNRYRDTATPLIMILSDIQREFGYVPPEVQTVVSRETGISVAQIYGVVTFYLFFSLEPKGKYVTGGVTEAVLRRLTDGHGRHDMDAIKASGVRGLDGVKEFTVDYEGLVLQIAVISGLANADRVMRRIRAGEIHYDLAEVMACPGGCVNGGGQPVGSVHSTVAERSGGLYQADVNYQIQRSNDNPLVASLYDGMLRGREHTLLHRNFSYKRT